jgi:glycosyltransferase involved in cell wall biosynthesis
MKLSIITINLNHKTGLKKTLRSLTSQTFRDFEWIVIDGGSTDGSIDMLSEEAMQPDVLISEADSGIYDAMNKGISYAKGSYLYFLNSGDALHDQSTLSCIFGEGKQDAHLLYGDFERWNREGSLVRVKSASSLTITLFFKEGLCHQSVFFHRSLFDHHQNYNTVYSVSADWHFIVNALIHGATSLYLNLPIVYYEGGGLSEQNIEQVADEKKKMLQMLLPPALYNDCVSHLMVQKERADLITLRNWVEGLKQRPLLKNIAMCFIWKVRVIRSKYFK